MDNTLLVALSRQTALQRALEVTANNIANINTTGFKADGVVFEEHLSERARDNRFALGDRRVSFVADRATWHNFRQGAVQPTGNPLDVAISGDGFLVVQTPRGERYTRNGALQISATGELVNPEGYPVLGDGGPITLQTQDRNITIAPDGTVSVSGGLRGRLRIVEFPQRERLQKDATSSFAAPDGVQPQPATRSRLVQGAVETSNVEGVIEISRMIEITRAYTTLSQLTLAQSDMRRSAIERLADVPA
ncbi:MAG TPA: flagellar basal-body rod protein FlgF [Xanthobacteraceae bacterium]|nr:flagellar basal-body rod protein FlgF [Xanthobacteraceae bacterium]